MYFGGHDWTWVHSEGLINYYRLTNIEELIPFDGATNKYASSKIYARCQECISWFDPITEIPRMLEVGVNGTSCIVWIPTKSMIDNQFDKTKNNNYGGRKMTYNGQSWQWWSADPFGPDGIENYYIHIDGTWWTAVSSGPISRQFGFVPHIKIL